MVDAPEATDDDHNGLAMEVVRHQELGNLAASVAHERNLDQRGAGVLQHWRQLAQFFHVVELQPAHQATRVSTASTTGARAAPVDLAGRLQARHKQNQSLAIHDSSTLHPRKGISGPWWAH